MIIWRKKESLLLSDLKKNVGHLNGFVLLKDGKLQNRNVFDVSVGQLKINFAKYYEIWKKIDDIHIQKRLTDALVANAEVESVIDVQKVELKNVEDYLLEIGVKENNAMGPWRESIQSATGHAQTTTGGSSIYFCSQ